LIQSSKGVTPVKTKRFAALAKIKEILQKNLIRSQISENLSPDHEIKDKMEIRDVREMGKKENYERKGRV
jgi:hypothetical protein